MKRLIIIFLLIVAAGAAAYFLSNTEPAENRFEKLVLASDAYEKAAEEIAGQINDLSPMPPTEQTWTVTEVEFVKGEPYAYATYHDNHNFFRMLIVTGQDKYQMAALFESADSGWKLTHGQDLAKGRETAKINPIKK